MSAKKRVLHDNEKEALPMAFPAKGLKLAGITAGLHRLRTPNGLPC